ncbi:MAG: DUF6029 family protein [Balneolia bacterium]|nr:DUF6029 family protein [Balneolia bacterium]
MQRFLRVFCIIILGVGLISAQDALAQQVQVSVNNIVNYGFGEEFLNLGDTTREKEYFENFTDVRILADNVIIGFRLELSDPAEYGPDFTGIRRRFIGYQRDGLDVRIGNLFALHNRGMSLNLFEDRVIRYDTSLDGVRAEYDHDLFRVKALAGSINYLEHLTFDSPSGIREENYRLRSGLLEFKPDRRMRIGGSYTYAEGDMPSFFFEDPDQAEIFIPEGFVSYRLPFARVTAGYNYRTLRLSNAADTTSITGGGIYGSINHTGPGYGVTFEYKNYSYDITDPFERQGDPLRNTRMSPFQSPPIVHREHSYSLMTRDPHLVNFEDEVGFFLEAFYSPTYNINLNSSIAVASLHDSWLWDDENFEFFQKEEGPRWLPGFADARDPFWEYYGHIEYFTPDFMSYVKLAYNHRNRLFYQALAPEFSQRVIANTFALDVQYAITPRWSVKAISEHQFVRDTQYGDDSDYYNQMFSLQIARSPDFSFGGRIESTTSEFDPSGEKFWYTVEGSMRIGRTHTLMASYGKERGGFVCTNGVCRFVNAFSGMRLSFLSSF